MAGAAHHALVAEAEVHPAGDHPEDLLVRVPVAGGVRARLHRPPHEHLLVAAEDAARDLVADLLLGQLFEHGESLGHRHDANLLLGGCAATVMSVVGAVKPRSTPARAAPASPRAR